MRNVKSEIMTATSYEPIHTATPVAAVADRLAAVAVPRTEPLSFRIAPPPMNPMPAIRPSMMRAVPSGCPVIKSSEAWMMPQVASATSGNVRKPALRSASSRFQPIGRASR